MNTVMSEVFASQTAKGYTCTAFNSYMSFQMLLNVLRLLVVVH